MSLIHILRKQYCIRSVYNPFHEDDHEMPNYAPLLGTTSYANTASSPKSHHLRPP